MAVIRRALRSVGIAGACGSAGSNTRKTRITSSSLGRREVVAQVLQPLDGGQIVNDVPGDGDPTDRQMTAPTRNELACCSPAPPWRPRFVRSPQQLVAGTAAPPRTVLTATVERRVLRDTIVLRGLVGAGMSIEATPTPRDAGLAVVTGVRVKAGQTIRPGSVSCWRFPDAHWWHCGSRSRVPRSATWHARAGRGPAPGGPDDAQVTTPVSGAVCSARARSCRTTGPMLPLAEFVFLPSFPARVEKLAARGGCLGAAAPDHAAERRTGRACPVQRGSARAPQGGPAGRGSVRGPRPDGRWHCGWDW
jgi:hypothetical protein